MRKLFGRRKPDPTDIVAERWETTFFWKQRSRFREEESPAYEARFQGRELLLLLKRRNLFAWVNDPLYRYRDFVLEADITLDPAAGNHSAGVAFRYVNESTYYYFLVSTAGLFRFDVVFNGNPIRLIDWTELPPPELPAEEGRAADRGQMDHRLLVVANGTRFTLCCDEQWLAEIDDETIDAGQIAFAAQNYNETDQAGPLLRRLLVDSRGIEVEAYQLRWREGIPVDPASRLRLARTLFTADNPTAAIIQIRKTARDREPDAETLFLLAECQLALGLNENALETIERSLALDGGRAEVQHEKANLLYLLGRYLELRDHLGPLVEEAGSSTLWNLYGHAAYSLGDWEGALAAYTRAVELEPEMPIFRINAARCCDHLERREQALASYLEAGRLLVRQEAYEDLAQIVSQIMALDPGNLDGRKFEGLLLFNDSDYDRAGRIFRELVDAGTDDTAVFYLLGLLRSRAGERRSALDLFTRAAEQEPDFPLYWFRVAETQYLLGERPDEALQRALDLAPEDPWTLNLAGQVRMDEGRLDAAVEAFARAAAIAPDEVEIAVNHAQALSQSGHPEEAIELLRERGEAAALNGLGNILTEAGRGAEALQAYERAYRTEPENPLITENYAAACIEADLVNRAEELLGKLVETAPSASVLNRVGNLARIEGDLPRAEAAYREALPYLGLPDFDQPVDERGLQRLASDPELNETVVELESNLAELYLQWFRYDHARRVLERLKQHSSSPKVLRIEERLRSATETRLNCAACGREWWAPRVVDVPATLRLHGEPPPESPAGRCPRCGKVYCVGCAVEHLRDNRFVCEECGENLKLNDDHLKYLVLKAVELSESGRT